MSSQTSVPNPPQSVLRPPHFFERETPRNAKRLIATSRCNEAFVPKEESVRWERSHCRDDLVGVHARVYVWKDLRDVARAIDEEGHA